MRLFLLSLCFMWNLGCYINYIEIGQRGRKIQPQEKVMEKGSADKIAVLNVNGVLTFQEDKDLLSARGNKVEQFAVFVQQVADDPKVKALVLKVDSPGGEVTASDLMYHELIRLKQKRPDLKIVACFLDVAASGAYYLSMAADRIVAHPTTVTGSIGVMQMMVSAEELLTRKLGLKDETVASGKNKTLGSPFHALTDEQRTLVQDLVDELYAVFLNVVRKGRPGIPEEKLKTLADGRVFTARQAKDHGLIDEVGYLEDALAEASKLAGLQQPTVVMYELEQYPLNNLYSKPLDRTSLDPIEALLEAHLRGGKGDLPAFFYLYLQEGSPR